MTSLACYVMRVIQVVMKGILQSHGCLISISYVSRLQDSGFPPKRSSWKSELETFPWPKIKLSLFTFNDTFFSRSAAPQEHFLLLFIVIVGSVMLS